MKYDIYYNFLLDEVIIINNSKNIKRKLSISFMIYYVNKIINDDDLNPLQNASNLIPVSSIVNE